MHSDRADTSPSATPIARSIFAYLALAYAIAWLAWLPLIRLHVAEEYLNIGVAGPALAALLLVRTGRRLAGFPLRRMVRFAGLAAGCWLLISLYYANRGSDHLLLRFNPWLLIPAALPAWILSSARSRDSGVREFAARLVHRPSRWTIYALLAFPALQLIPAALMHLLHQPLVWPAWHGKLPYVVLNGLLFLAFNIFFVGVQEEPGWRGFLLDRLQLRFSPVLASILIWLPWALWHGPLDYFRPVPYTLVFWLLLRVITLIPLCIIFTWFYNRSGRSIQATVMFHAGMNSAPILLPYSQPAMALLFVWAGWIVFSDKMWRRLPARRASAKTEPAVPV